MGVPTLIIAHGTALPARDRNEQHPDPPQHHPANAAYPRREVRSGTCLHLLIAGSPLLLPCQEFGQLWWHSRTIAGDRGGSLCPVDLPEHPGRSVLKCRSQTSKAREGSPSVGSNPTATAIYQVNAGHLILPMISVCAAGCICLCTAEG